MALDYEAWEERYRNPRPDRKRHPNGWLAQHVDRLPPGRALDVAMGEGRNSLFLARRGYEVTGVDRSPTAVARALAWAAEEGLEVEAQVRDLETCRLPEGPFDVVVVTRFLQRSLFGPLVEALRPGGMLVYETFTLGRLANGDFDPAHLLQPGELRRAFQDLEILAYREEDRPAYQASLLARKPSAP